MTVSATIAPSPYAKPVAPGPQAASSDPAANDIDKARERAREQAEEFESVFLTMFVKQMFSGIKTEGPFTGGSSEGIYREMMSEEYAKSIAKSGGIGLADHVYSEILKTQQIEP